MERFMQRFMMGFIALIMLLCCVGGVVLLVMRYNGLPGDTFCDGITVGLIVCAASFCVLATVHAIYPETILEVASNLH